MSKTEEKIKKSQIANWLIDVLGDTKISNEVFSKLVDNEYDNYLAQKNYEEQISVLSMKLIEKTNELEGLEDKYNDLYDLNCIISNNTLKIVKKQCDIVRKKVCDEFYKMLSTNDDVVVNAPPVEIDIEYIKKFQKLMEGRKHEGN